MKAHIRSNCNSKAIESAFREAKRDVSPINASDIVIDETLKPTNQLTAMNGADDYNWKPIPSNEILASAFLSNGMYVTIGKNLKAADIYRDSTLTELITMEHGFVMGGFGNNTDGAIRSIIGLVESYLDELS